MNCETFRERLGADPAIADADCERHAESCAACAAYRDRLLAGEALIQQALRFDPGAVRRTSPAYGRGQTSWVTFVSGLAAGVVVALSAWALLAGRVGFTPEALAVEVANHWYHEPEVWVTTDARVADAVLTEVLNGEVVLDAATRSAISHAESCWVGGEWIPHLVIQSEQGPVMVLLIFLRGLELIGT